MRYFMFLILSCGLLSSCMLKSQHDASIAEYQKRAENSQELQQENTTLKQQVSDLELRNQDLSTLNQQLVIKNKQLTENQFNQKNQSLEELRKNQQSKQTYLAIYDQLVKKINQSKLILNDSYVGIKIERNQLFANTKPNLSSSGESFLQQIIQVLPSQLRFSIEVDYQDKDQNIKRGLEKTYVSHLSLKAFEAALIAHYFTKATPIESLAVQTTVSSAMINNTDETFILKISQIP
ncbi:MAG TPA: hypothetical protein PKC21_06320 [Oligoflexia bacterium]|nr:hypothetical protein [Oligoflexia bacterium]HMR24950.1 hypothetical protein [Oligoflexia bacterium]